ncbi:YkuS family protein [Acetohalobium arabaticum]|uniref:Uncharacterized protein family (UPF0180) n=1 Tax=Acetohalobium arabaticum (strain ATCC 49924 / DSM 5501 / Z-7288) TaxID=574087 RepID=D9QTL1_ACEAZ|nr:YkuS family protein [Acetohalobium arabaticum]ADL11775.1 uncharacterized protein family (UPF0180) [Acetohalobium arabaticum DSM 5501]
MKNKGKKKVAVEEGLSEVAQELKKSGFEVATLGANATAKGDTDTTQKADAVIVNGQNQEAVKTANEIQGKVINAKNLSPNQVKEEVKNKVK